jgi:hypothetical protein
VEVRFDVCGTSHTFCGNCNGNRVVILFAANTLFGLKIAYSWLNILICAIGGVIGAVIVIILTLFGGMF